MDSYGKKSVVYAGINIVYWCHGASGERALIFVHGWTCNSSLWYHQAPLCQKYHSLLIDLPGHGESDSPDIEYSQELFARAIKAVMTKENIDKAVLVGHSMGGPVSTMFLRLFPHQVAGIVYVDSFFHMPEHYFTEPQRRALAREHENDDKFRARIDLFWTSRTTSRTRMLVAKTMNGTPKHVRISAVTTDHLPHAMRWDDVFQDLPALHIVSPMFENIDRHWLHHIPRLSTQVWRENGHFLFMEDPSRFNDEVQDFITEHHLFEAHS